MPRGKKYLNAVSKYDREQFFSPAEAISLAKQMASATFDETIELSMRLGVDPRKADQMVRGSVVLPRGTGKTRRVAVFAQGDHVRQAREAGADEVGDADLAGRIEKGWLDFDVAVATPDMMPVVGKLGRILGPRGLMPNPKSGTVTNDVAKAVREVKGGRIEYRVDRQANLHVGIGKVSFETEALIENYLTVVDEVARAKPGTSKGKYLKSLTVSSTMGPGIRIDPNRAREGVVAAAS